jgi:meromycolic acid enoyl-[acyl-carrier-protein] reductase
MGLLVNRTVLITGVLTERSIAAAVVRCALDEGANVLVTTPPPARRATTRALKSLDAVVPLIELDAADDESIRAAAASAAEHCDHLDGVLHAIGWAPANCLGSGMFTASRQEVGQAFDVSCVSLASLATAFRPLLRATADRHGGALVGLDFDASRTWPAYDWMGVAKAAYESLARYLARDLGPEGIRVNLVAAGPLRTPAARSIPGFAELAAQWSNRAPLGWDLDDPLPVARCVVALFSEYFTATTGAIIPVDGGVHAQGG